MCGITKIAFDFERVIFLSLKEKKFNIARLKLKIFKESTDYITACRIIIVCEHIEKEWF